MKLIDLVIMLAAMFTVTWLGLNAGERDKEREIVVAAQHCWDNGDRAVYIRVDGEYRIRCEP